MLKTEGVNHVIAQSVNHVSLDMIAAPTGHVIFSRALLWDLHKKGRKILRHWLLPIESGAPEKKADKPTGRFGT